MNPTFIAATAADRDLVLTLMAEFYAVEHLPFDPAVAASALQQVLDDPSRGAVHLIHVDGAANGYVVIAFNFSLEFHGRYAWIDELYVRAHVRGRGVGTAVLEFVEALCRREGLAAVRLEVGRANQGARRLYGRRGYEDYSRDLLTKWIRSTG